MCYNYLCELQVSQQFTTTTYLSKNPKIYKNSFTAIEFEFYSKMKFITQYNNKI